MDATSEDVDMAANILHLPMELIEKTLSYLTYDENTKCRLVCKTFDKICQQLLNQGFGRAEKFHGLIHREIKSKLPRRESERRTHPLARHMDLLATLETRLSLLAMTYIKYIEMGCCCFIPGQVLDEIFRILTRIKTEPSPPRPHELLTELRDISSMAMEHFEENMVPLYKAQMKIDVRNRRSALTSTGNSVEPLPGPSGLQGICGSLPPPPPPSSTFSVRRPAFHVEILQLRKGLTSTRSNVISLRKEVTDSKATITQQAKKIQEQDKKILSLNWAFNDLKKKMADQDRVMTDLRNTLLRLEAREGTAKAFPETYDTAEASSTQHSDVKQATDSAKDLNIIMTDLEKGSSEKLGKICKANVDKALVVPQSKPQEKDELFPDFKGVSVIDNKDVVNKKLVSSMARFKRKACDDNIGKHTRSSDGSLAGVKKSKKQ